MTDRDRDVMRAVASIFGGLTALAAVGAALAGYWLAAVIAGGIFVVAGLMQTITLTPRGN